MLTAIGRDANDQMFPIKWAVVAIENKESWLWFLTLLRLDLDIDEAHKWVVMSDEQKVSIIYFTLCLNFKASTIYVSVYNMFQLQVCSNL